MKRRYYLVPDSILSIKDGQKVFAGDVIARLPKKLLRQKILQEVYQELLNYLKQEKQKIVLLLLKMMDKLYLVKKLEENKEYLLFQKMEPNLQII
jgi:multidrug efflux pump subunit AcrA (membrane-fusion protein)